MGHFDRRRATHFPCYLASLVLPIGQIVSTAQAGGPPSVKMGWATKRNIFEDVRGHKETQFVTCQFYGKFVVQGFFFYPFLLTEKAQNLRWKIGVIK